MFSCITATSPVYKYRSHGIGLKEIVDICIAEDVPEDKICVEMPRNVLESCIFIVDTNAVPLVDVTTDDNGIYASHACPKEKILIEKDSDENILSFQSLRKRSSDVQRNPTDEEYCIKRQYSTHKRHPDVTRVIVTVYKNTLYQPMRYCIIQYKIPDNFAGFTCESSHGNSKRKDPYVRTKPSVIKKISTQLGNNVTPKNIVSNIENSSGGVMNSHPSNLVRNRRQVYNQTKHVVGRKKVQSTGPNRVPDMNKLLEFLKSSDFLQEVSFTEGRCRTFAATELQIHWLKTFCNGDKPSSQVSIDTTYNCGPFFVTAMTFAHPMFHHYSSPSTHPSILVAMSTSSGREEVDYKILPTSLKKEGIDSLIYGTDGEMALEKAFEEVFPPGQNIHLRCFTHIQQDIKRKLKELNVGEETQKRVIAQILGKEYQGKRYIGLVDTPVDEFDSKLEILAKSWPTEFKDWFFSKKGRLRSMPDMIKKCMLKELRTAAGLGNPANKFTTQRSEAMNKVIKDELGHQTTDLITLHEIIEKRIVHQQRSELTKAIYGMGEYRLCSEFQHLSTTPKVWAEKTPQQKEAHVQLVLGPPDKRAAKGNKRSSMYAEINKNAGQKPGRQKRRGKNNIQMLPIAEEADLDELELPKPTQYEKFYQNNNPFILVFLDDVPKGKRCIGCSNEFPRAPCMAPFDMVLKHEERFLYPNSDGVWNQISKKKTVNKYYCINFKRCIKERHPYFWRGRVQIDEALKPRLTAEHQKFLYEHLRVKVEG